jgi:hypothetical protein
LAFASAAVAFSSGVGLELKEGEESLDLSLEVKDAERGSEIRGEEGVEEDGMRFVIEEMDSAGMAVVLASRRR